MEQRVTMLDGLFNDILPSNYYRIPEIIGHGKAFLIETGDQLEQALSTSENFFVQRAVHTRRPSRHS
jgi:hypothetical protein